MMSGFGEEKSSSKREIHNAVCLEGDRMSFVSRIWITALGITLACGVLSCGSATNNDQGTSFLALGFFEGSEESAGDAGTVVFLNEDAAGRLPSQPVPLFVPVDKDTSEDGVQGGYIGVENRMTSQFIRTIGADCSYEVPGADPSLSIPSDSWYFTAILDPAAGEGDDIRNQAFVQILIVSPDVISFLSVNSNYLPALPFKMLATCTVTGITQAGDEIVTNPIHYQIVFAEFPECCTGVLPPTVGFQGGTGTGGSFDSFGDGESSDSSDDTGAATIEESDEASDVIG